MNILSLTKKIIFNLSNRKKLHLALETPSKTNNILYYK